MGRVALLLGAALCACASVFRSPPMLRQHASGEPQTPASNDVVADPRLQAFIKHGLGELATALEPLCGFDCRFLEAQADPELEWPLALRADRSRSGFVVVYHPDQFGRMAAYSESVATYGLAHEMGHYIDVAVAHSELDDPWRLELSADAIAGCAFELLGRSRELVQSTYLAMAAPADSLDARLDLVCGVDREHPAIRWQLEASDAGARLCQSGPAPLSRLEAEVADLTHDSRRAAEKARAWLSPVGDPCRVRRFDDRLRTMLSR